MPYNPDIAHMVFLRGFIEKIGRGTILIADACRKAGLKAPSWEIGDQTVKLTFYRDGKFGGDIEGDIKGADAVDSEGAIKGVIEGAIKGSTKGVKEKLALVLRAITRDEGKRVPEYMTITGLSESSIERYLQQLRTGRLIEFKGEATNTGGYYLTKKAKVKLK